MSATPVLETKDLGRRFGGLRAVDGVSFSVPEGQVLGVIGPNGAGKSTFINLVTGHIKPTSGQVLIQGKDMTGARPWAIAHAGVARTFQIVKPFRGMSVRENVAVGILYGRKGAARMGQALEEADAVLHEVMAGLRHSEIEPSLELIKHLKSRGLTIIVVEHVMRAILAISDQVLVLHQGKVLTSGDPRTVLSDPRVIEAYLGQRYVQRREGGAS